MILQNLMEEKQLNLSRPLLSVRRSPSSILPSESDKNTKPANSLPKAPSLPFYRSELKSGPIRNPGTVPFQWECTPGTPNNQTKSQQQSLEKPPVAPKLPPGRTLNLERQAVSRNCGTHGDHLRNPQTSEKKNEWHKVEESRSFEPEYDEYENDDDYVDAADTLSRSESFFLNCSVSGVSGLDGPDMDPSGVFLSDPQTRDFMMGRFLPAAKAMASETPPHQMRKQTVAKEQPILIKKPDTQEKRCAVKRSPNILPYVQHPEAERCNESDEEEEDDCGRPENKMHGICGLLPHICLKSSFGLLNPVPGVRMQAQKAVSVRRRRANNFNSGAYRANEHEKTRGAQFEQMSVRGDQTIKTHEQSVFGTKPLQEKALRDNQLSTSIIVHEGKKTVEHVGESNINSVTKGGKNFAELLAIEDKNWDSGFGSPVPEKTVYIDTVHKVKFADTSGVTDYEVDQSNDHPKLEVDELRDGTTKVEKAVNSCFGSSPGRLTNETLIKDHGVDGTRNVEMDENKGVSLENEGLKKLWIQEQTQEQNLAIVPVAGNCKKMDLEMEERKKASALESCNGKRPGRPAPPPLPQAPSDSWLKRTLPTVSAKNSFSWSSLGLMNNGCEDPKWETMVKTSNVQPGHLRFSAEKLDSIPEA